MADPFTDAFHARLHSGPLTKLLARYHGQAAIFTTRPVPPDAGLPYLVTEGELVRGPFDTKLTRGVDLIREIYAFAAADGDPARVEEIAGLVFDLFHRHPLQVEGYATLVAAASGPMVAPTDDTIYGRYVSVRLVTMRQEL